MEVDCLSQKQHFSEKEGTLEQCQPVSAVSEISAAETSAASFSSLVTSPRHTHSISTPPSRADGSTAISRQPRNRLGLRCLAGCYQPTHLLI